MHLRIGISITAIILIVARFIWPDIKIDTITIGLFIVAVLPWVTSLIESAKFPGGWEVKFRDVKAAGEKIPLPKTEQTALTQHSFQNVVEQDPNLAMVGLRIEIEKRVRELAGIAGVNPNQPLTRLFRELQRSEEINPPFYSGLQELIMAGNQAAHGAKVEPSVADWAFDVGPRVLATLDEVIERRKGNLRPGKPSEFE